MERRFVFSELKQDFKIGDDPSIYKSMELITESELKRRLAQIINLYQEEGKPTVIEPCVKDIGILLHGNA